MRTTLFILLLASSTVKAQTPELRKYFLADGQGNDAQLYIGINSHVKLMVTGPLGIELARALLTPDSLLVVAKGNCYRMGHTILHKLFSQTVSDTVIAASLRTIANGLLVVTQNITFKLVTIGYISRANNKIIVHLNYNNQPVVMQASLKSGRLTQLVIKSNKQLLYILKLKKVTNKSFNLKVKCEQLTP